jgi:hypothetical protein
MIEDRTAPLEGRQMTKRHALVYGAASIDSPAELDQAIIGCNILINCAGPFAIPPHP